MKYYYEYEGHSGCADFPIPGLLTNDEEGTITETCTKGYRVNNNCVPEDSNFL